MIKIKNVIYSILFALLLTSCVMGGLDIDAAKKASFDNLFKEGLRERYIELAESELAEGDREDAERYGRKAMLLVHGVVPDVENLYSREISLTRMNNLLGAKYFIEAAFAHNMREIQPDISAEAQVMFDCWVEYAEESKHAYEGKALECKNRFDVAKDQISRQLDRIKEQKKMQQEAQMQAQQKSFERTLEQKQAEIIRKYHKMPEPSYIFFPYNSTKLDITAKNLLKKVAGDVGIFNPRKIVITGNTDNTGSYDYNMRLALRRGQEAADYLISLGVDRDILDVKAYGENNPRKTYNGSYKDVRNRYVKIIFLKDNRVYY